MDRIAGNGRGLGAYHDSAMGGTRLLTRCSPQVGVAAQAMKGTKSLGETTSRRRAPSLTNEGLLWNFGWLTAVGSRCGSVLPRPWFLVGPVTSGRCVRPQAITSSASDSNYSILLPLARSPVDLGPQRWLHPPHAISLAVPLQFSLSLR